MTGEPRLPVLRPFPLEGACLFHDVHEGGWLQTMGSTPVLPSFQWAAQFGDFLISLL